jgi:hypothetical protein
MLQRLQHHAPSLCQLGPLLVLLSALLLATPTAAYVNFTGWWYTTTFWCSRGSHDTQYFLSYPFPVLQRRVKVEFDWETGLIGLGEDISFVASDKLYFQASVEHMGRGPCLRQ